MCGRGLKATTSLRLGKKMTSSEPGRTSPYSEDLRWKIVWQSMALGLSNSTVARNLCVDASTVSRIVGLFHSTGTVTKRSYPNERASRKLTQPCQLLILHTVIQKPGIFLHEIQREIEDVLLVSVSVPTICKFIHQSGFTRQRLKNVALQQDAFMREQYKSEVSVFTAEMFVFIDETGVDRRNTLRRYGYSIRGRPATNHSLLVRVERISAIASISMDGLLDVKIVKGTSNGNTFYDFVQEILLPHLMPFYGRNPHSVVVLDNCAIHHVAEVKSVLEEVGVLVYFCHHTHLTLIPLRKRLPRLSPTLKA